eukprot:sb/3479301/
MYPNKNKNKSRLTFGLQPPAELSRCSSSRPPFHRHDIISSAHCFPSARLYIELSTQPLQDFIAYVTQPALDPVCSDGLPVHVIGMPGFHRRSEP